MPRPRRSGTWTVKQSISALARATLCEEIRGGLSGTVKQNYFGAVADLPVANECAIARCHRSSFDCWRTVGHIRWTLSGLRQFVQCPMCDGLLRALTRSGPREAQDAPAPDGEEQCSQNQQEPPLLANPRALDRETTGLPGEAMIGIHALAQDRLLRRGSREQTDRVRQPLVVPTKFASCPPCERHTHERSTRAQARFPIRRGPPARRPRDRVIHRSSPGTHPHQWTRCNHNLDMDCRISP